MTSTYSYTLEPAHWFTYAAAAQKKMRRATRKSGYGRLMTWLGLTILFLVAGGWLVQSGFGPAHALAFTFGAMGAWVLLSTYLVQWQRYTYRHGLKSDGIVLGPKTLTIGDDGLVISGTMFEQRYEWGSVDGVEVAGDIVIIWFEPIVGTFIPTSTLGGDDGVRAFTDTIKRRLVQRPA